MKKIDVENWERRKTYEWFKTFSNATYSCNVKMNVTKLVNYSKLTSTSFFVNMLYVVVSGLNSIDEMRMRLVHDVPIIYDDINPAYTVMTDAGTFENVRHKNYKDYKTFYEVVSEHTENTKKQKKLNEENYNPEDCYDEYYITCLPWVNFEQLTHPMPDDISSQCIPRICWGKYEKNRSKYELTLNITVSHLFVDGYPLSKAFIKIQELLDDIENVLK